MSFIEDSIPKQFLIKSIEDNNDNIKNMSLHTWSYYKIDDYDKETILKIVNKNIDKNVLFLNRLINDIDSVDKSLLAMYPEWKDKEYNQKELQKANDLKLKINNHNLTVDELTNIVYNTPYFSMYGEYVEGRGWFRQTDEFHNMFKIFDYETDVKLFSYDETINFIQNNHCETYENTYQRVREFWDKYPDGMIDFG